MCHFCQETDLEAAKAQLTLHGFEFLPPDSPRQYGVSWDGRIIAHTEKQERAVQMAAEQDASQPGRWEAMVRRCGPWVPVDAAGEPPIPPVLRAPSP